MKFILLILALFAAVFGLASAWYWWKSSRVVVDPEWEIEPVLPELAQMGWLAAQLKAGDAVANLNKTAALYTAISIVFGALSSVLGVLPSI